jgi:hypothetical protein
VPDQPRNGGAIVPRDRAGHWIAGGPSPNPGGKPRKTREIEEMLDAEHRTVENMREVYGRLKALAMGELVTVMDEDGEVTVTLKADARFMAIYLDRLWGPVKLVDDHRVDAAVRERMEALIIEARARRERDDS